MTKKSKPAFNPAPDLTPLALSEQVSALHARIDRMTEQANIAISAVDQRNRQVATHSAQLDQQLAQFLGEHAQEHLAIGAALAKQAEASESHNTLHIRELFSRVQKLEARQPDATDTFADALRLSAVEDMCRLLAETLPLMLPPEIANDFVERMPPAIAVTVRGHKITPECNSGDDFNPPALIKADVAQAAADPLNKARWLLTRVRDHMRADDTGKADLRTAASLRDEIDQWLEEA